MASEYRLHNTKLRSEYRLASASSRWALSQKFLRSARVARSGMQSSIFNVRVPLADGREVFLMNTFTDAQLIVSREVSDLLDRVDDADYVTSLDAEAREAFHTLAENGFIVESRDTDRRNV